MLYKNNSTQGFQTLSQAQTMPNFKPKTIALSKVANYQDWKNSQGESELLTALKKENSSLKEHNNIIEKYLLNVTKVFDSLSQENKNLRQEIQQRTIDLQKVIESAALNQSMNEKDLQHQIELYEEELRVISSHMDGVLGQDATVQEKITALTQQIDNAKALNSQLQKNLLNMQQREKDAINELSLKNLQNQELAAQRQQLQNKVHPLEEKLKQLSTQNELLSQQVNTLETTKKYLEDEDSNKVKEFQETNYKQKTDLEHFKHLCSQQDVMIKELKQELLIIKNENYTEKIKQLQKEIDISKQECALEQKRHKNTQIRENTNYQNYTNTNLQLEQLKNRYDLLKIDYDKLSEESENQQQHLKDKQQNVIERLKLNHASQIIELNNENLKLQDKIKELTMQIEQLKREIDQQNRQLQTMHDLQLKIEQLNRTITDLQQQLQSRDHTHELRVVQLQDNLELQKKKLLDLEERYASLQETYKKEQEKNEQLYIQNEQLKWYQEQYDEVVGKLQEIKIEKENYKIELNTYQSKITQIEINYEESKQKYIYNEQEVKNLQAQIRALEKKLIELEQLKFENKILREGKVTVQIPNMTTTIPKSSSTDMRPIDEVNEEPIVYTRSFNPQNAQSNKTLTTQTSRQNLKQVQTTTTVKHHRTQQAQYDLQLELKNYPYRTYFMNK